MRALYRPTGHWDACNNDNPPGFKAVAQSGCLKTWPPQIALPEELIVGPVARSCPWSALLNAGLSHLNVINLPQACKTVLSYRDAGEHQIVTL